jgi:hypothetical protein
MFAVSIDLFEDCILPTLEDIQGDTGCKDLYYVVTSAFCLYLRHGCSNDYNSLLSCIGYDMGYLGVNKNEVVKLHEAFKVFGECK